MSQIGENFSIGLIEAVLDCPYSFWTITCKSDDSIVYKIKKEEFFMKINFTASALMKNVKERLSLIAERIEKVQEVYPEFYFQKLNDEANDLNDNIDTFSKSNENIECSNFIKQNHPKEIKMRRYASLKRI